RILLGMKSSRGRCRPRLLGASERVSHLIWFNFSKHFEGFRLQLISVGVQGGGALGKRLLANGLEGMGVFPIAFHVAGLGEFRKPLAGSIDPLLRDAGIRY